MHRRARPLRADGVLRDLHGQLLADVYARSGHRPLRALVRHAVADVEEGVLLPADVDESRLHARQDVLHLSFVDIADEVRLRFALDLDGQEFVVRHDRHARFLGRTVYKNGFHYINSIIRESASLSRSHG